MSDKNDKSVSRRDALRLATAVSALGVGLGISLDSEGASAEEIKFKYGSGSTWALEESKVGAFFLKIFAHTADGKEVLVGNIDVSALAMKYIKLQNIKLDFIKRGFSLEVHNIKGGATAKPDDELVIRHQFDVKQHKM
jgi:hypothetical protein